MRLVISLLIKIGRPILWLLKLPTKLKLPVIEPPKIKFPRFSWPKIEIKKRIKKKIPVVKKIKKKRVKEKVFLWKYPSLFLFTLAFTGLLVWSYQEVLKNLPNINEIYVPPKLSTKIYDRNDNLLYQFFEDEDRSWIGLEQIPEELISATIAIEDKEFYKHHGFSVKGIVKAIIYNFNKNEDQKLRGGSTITQQLVKNVFLNGEKSWKRKIKEAVLSLLLEEKLSKNQILERYFNQVPYGGSIYGVAEASYRYFGKEVGDLELAEAAFMAGLPAAPSSYSPFNIDGFKLAKARQEHVLDEMVSSGTLDIKKAEEAKKEELVIMEDKRDILAPHFVFYIKNYLEKLGFSKVESQGLRVRTSLDLNVQKEVEKIVKEEIEKTKKLRISNGAVLVQNVKTGDILAMVGSKDYFAKDINGKFDVVTQGLRQPGSSIKPLNYLLALQKGRNMWDTIDDNSVTYNVPGQKPYSPQNYTGKYLGKVTLKTALASSLNIPSVKLLNDNGVENLIDLAERMGITTWTNRSRFGLSLALGAGEVKMTELAQAYSIFANLGERVEINPVLEIDNYLGEKVYQKYIEKSEIVEAKHAYLINNALSDDQARSPIFGANSLLNIKGKTVAVKTGTTNDLKDNWCIGWTPTYLTAVWVGNNDNTPMSWVASGISGATPIWNRVMKELLANSEDENWKVPNELHLEDVCGKKEWVEEGMKVRKDCPTATPTAKMEN